MQNEAAMEIKKANPSTSIDQIKLKMDTLFEKHRVTAYESILKVSLDRKNLAETNMLKAYVTFVTTAELEGYE